MKYKAMLYAVILSPIFFMQCSADPQDDYRNFNLTTPDPTSKPPDNPTVFVDTSNARMIVHTIDDATWDAASEMGYINKVILGTLPYDGYGVPGSTNTVQIFIDSKSDNLYVRNPGYYQESILGTLGIQEWEFTYARENDLMEISGLSNLTLGYYCTDPDQLGVNMSLSFTGTYNEFNFRYEGTYVWEQNSIYSGCELRCSGSMSIQIE